MRGIREAAMSQEEEPIKEDYWKTPVKKQKSFFEKDYEDYNDPYNPSASEIKEEWRGEYSNSESIDAYEKNKEKVITISVFIPEKELEDEMEAYYMTYDMGPLETKAIEMSYDKFNEILNKDYESKYDSIYEADYSVGGIEVTLTLTKLK